MSVAPYLLLADLHCHSWSQFSSIDERGVNTRLLVITEELRRAAGILKTAGGDHIILAGDLFHARGSIDPEVFNVIHETIAELIEDGFRFSAVPGNHDLKGKDTTDLGNAFSSFGELENFDVFDAPSLTHAICAEEQMCVMVPWQSSNEKLLRVCRETFDALKKRGHAPETLDLIIHAGIDGVLSGVPAHGLTSADLKALGFNRVFAGHYHHHVEVEDGVYSIGATTHQTWSDVGTKAGFLLVYPDRVQYSASHAPSFVEIDSDTLEEDIPLIVDGNYVRISAMKLSDADINIMRDELMGMDAKGVLFQVVRETVSARTGTVLKTKTLAESITDYVAGLSLPSPAPVQKRCADILSKASETAS